MVVFSSCKERKNIEVDAPVENYCRRVTRHGRIIVG
jgi:hypothetical protein